MLFGDGAGAVVVEPMAGAGTTEDRGLLGFALVRPAEESAPHVWQHTELVQVGANLSEALFDERNAHGDEIEKVIGPQERLFLQSLERDDTIDEAPFESLLRGVLAAHHPHLAGALEADDFGGL